MTIYTSRSSVPTLPYLYIWRDEYPNKFYCGIHNGNQGYRYVGSGAVFEKHFKARPDDFERIKIVHNISYEYIRRLEERFLHSMYAAESVDWYNMINTNSVGMTGNKHTTATKDKIRQYNLGTKRTEETKEKMRQRVLGRKHSEETKARMRATWARKREGNKLFDS